MLITKENQESWVNSYIKEKHSQDECSGFIDGINKALEYVTQKMTPIEESNINCNAKDLAKYQIKQEDWDNVNLVEMKMKAESVVSLFVVLENILAPHISPEESEMIDKTKNHLLNYLDEFFINGKCRTA